MKFLILVALPYLSANSTCRLSQFGCCRDNITISPTFDRRGCPGMEPFLLENRMSVSHKSWCNRRGSRPSDLSYTHTHTQAHGADQVPSTGASAVPPRPVATSESN